MRARVALAFDKRGRQRGFDMQGEPSVRSLAEALRTSYTAGLDVLVLDNGIIRK
ncbi:MAG: hypothetical protein H7274_01060 [Rhodoferax sp.]|nr:hypothetical protein [Rhodoferax sp.]